ncbi:Phage-related baseplate assembly protein [Planctomycetes bacterium Pan216]|uniref:Phage-related baseplate assembly protein n=1 Tax=Kolteria novifilia TaxID=2527975 RepID=A0A518B745_9BACT|nr:Phage-related baseplate assembly protein [Planctomycetes bacterium Pan216]
MASASDTSTSQQGQFVRLDFDHAGRGIPPLDQDVLCAVALDGDEALSELYRFDVEAVIDRGRDRDQFEYDVEDQDGQHATKRGLDFEDVIGRPLTITLKSNTPDAPRLIHGVVSEIEDVGQDERFDRFKLRVVPALWTATLNRRFMVFVDKTIKEVIEHYRKLYTDLDFDLSQLGDTYPKHALRVQFDESDCDFLRRILDEEGIYFSFRHTKGRHTIVFADDSRLAREPIDAPYALQTHGAISSWRRSRRLRPTKVRLGDHCTAHEPEQAHEATRALSFAPEDRLGIGEYREYPASIGSRVGSEALLGGNGAVASAVQIGESLSVRRLEEARRDASLASATSDLALVAAGSHVTMNGHPHADGSYFVTRVEHQVRQGEYHGISLGKGQEKTGYSNRFTCQSTEQAFRPTRRQHRRRPRGPLTATVIGTQGAEIDTNILGEVKVAFLGAEYPGDEPTSTWVPVRHEWSGHHYGLFTLPRIGQRVMVDFINGEMERPVVVGSLWDTRQEPPLDLSVPANRNKFVLKSKTVQGDEHDNFNGLLLNDDKGKESASLRAQNELFLASKNECTIAATSTVRSYAGASSVNVVGGFPMQTYTIKDNATGTETGSSSSGTNGRSDQQANGSSSAASPQSREVTRSTPSSNSSAPLSNRWGEVEMKVQDSLGLPFGSRTNMTGGFNTDSTMGWYTSANMGGHELFVIEPLYLGELLGVRSAKVLNVSRGVNPFGTSQFTMGSRSTFHFGPTDTIVRHNGSTFEYHSHRRAVPTVWSNIYAMTRSLSLLMPWIPMGYDIGVNPIADVVKYAAIPLDIVAGIFETKWAKANVALSATKRSIAIAKAYLKRAQSLAVASPWNAELQNAAKSAKEVLEQLVEDEKEMEKSTDLGSGLHKYLDGTFETAAERVVLSAHDGRNAKMGDILLHATKTAFVTAPTIVEDGNLIVNGDDKVEITTSSTGALTFGARKGLNPERPASLKIDQFRASLHHGKEVIIDTGVSSNRSTITLTGPSIKIQVGTSTISISKQNITMKAVNINLEALAAINLKSPQTNVTM